MSKNKEIIIKALFISALYGAIATVILNIFTATYIASVPGVRDIEVVTGTQAIQMQIEAFGFTQYLLSLIPWYAVMFCVILGGCLLHAYWLCSNKSATA